MTKDAGTRIMKSLSKGWIWKTVGSPQQAWEATGGSPQQAQVFPRTSDRDWFCLQHEFSSTDSFQTLASKTVTLWYFFTAVFGNYSLLLSTDH